MFTFFSSLSGQLLLSRRLQRLFVILFISSSGVPSIGIHFQRDRRKDGLRSHEFTFDAEGGRRSKNQFNLARRHVRHDAHTGVQRSSGRRFDSRQGRIDWRSEDFGTPFYDQRNVQGLCHGQGFGQPGCIFKTFARGGFKFTKRSPGWLYFQTIRQGSLQLVFIYANIRIGFINKNNVDSALFITVKM